MVATLTPPFPHFGGKRAIAPIIWDALGDVGVYVEPFFGSGSILLARPTPPHVETVNDADCYLTNFWRALQQAPDKVAEWASYPVSELDLHAQHCWLMRQQDFREHLRRDPDYYDAKLAGWWVWGVCCWIGGGWCREAAQSHRQVPLIDGMHHGRGIHRTFTQQQPAVQGDHPGTGIVCPDDLTAWFAALATRLHRVRICCGDWERVCTPVVLNGAGITGIVLDPPYGHSERDVRLYGTEPDCTANVAAWAREHGANPRYRIVLCGYDTEHVMPGWTQYCWQANGGYGNQSTSRGKANRQRERLWFSPHCQTVTTQLTLFTEASA